MCDPLTMILGAVSAGTALLGGQKKAPAPPPAAIPAFAADPAHASGAAVQIGNGNDADIRNTDKNTSAQPSAFQETRKAGTALGGLTPLGRSDLAL